MENGSSENITFTKLYCRIMRTFFPSLAISYLVDFADDTANANSFILR